MVIMIKIFKNGSIMFYNASILLKPPFPFPPGAKGFALLPLCGRLGWGSKHPVQ
jgi:hypothetical protein